MAVTVKQVRQALVRLKKVRATRSHVEVLRSVRIDADGMHSTDMVAALTIRLDTGLEVPVQVDPVQLGQALKGWKGSDVVRLEPLPGAYGLRVNGATLPGSDPLDWPEWASGVLDAPRVAMPAGMFDAMLDVARAAASGDESRPILTGVQVRTRGDSVQVAATDSYRLARVCMFGGDVFGESLDLVLPVKCGKYLEAIGSAGSMIVGKGLRVQLVADDATLTLRRIEGTFPNADQLIPDAWEASGMTSGMLEPVERIASVAGREGHPLELELVGGSACVLWATREASVDPVSLPGSWHHDGDMTIGVNARYLLDGLRFVGDRESIRFISPLRPILLGDRYERCYLVMPVRIGTPARDRIAEQSAASGEQVPA